MGITGQVIYIQVRLLKRMLLLWEEMSFIVQLTDILVSQSVQYYLNMSDKQKNTHKYTDN